MADPFRSKRLIYRAVEPEDEAFFLVVQQDPTAFANSNIVAPRPQNKKDAVKYMQNVEDSMIGVVICLPSAEQSEDGKPRDVPIGTVFLKKMPLGMTHHRFSEIGIDIIKPYQGQGYGSEAISWILDWAFESAGLHRVNIRAFAYNDGAVRLYDRLGFTREGVGRESIWAKGRYWDDIQWGMLEREWRAIREQQRLDEEASRHASQ